MSDPALEAAQALAPLFSVGVDAAMAEVRRQIDAGAAALIRRVLEQIRGSVGENISSEQQAAEALRSAVQEGAVTTAELEEVVRLIRPIEFHHMDIGGNAYINSNIRVDGGGSFHG